MVFYDSSVLIDYLAGVERAVDYVESNTDRRSVTTPLVLFEVYQGEIYRADQADFEALDLALSWLSVIEATADTARAAAELQANLIDRGDPLTARDAFIAGAALNAGDRLAAADSDFRVSGLKEVVDVDYI